MRGSHSDPSFRFSFTVEEHGWATIELQAAGSGTPCRWRVSYLSDALGDFVRAVRDVSVGQRSSAAVRWHLEPAVVTCQLEPVAGAISCTVSAAASEAAPSRMLTSFPVPAERLVAGLLEGAAGIDRAAYAACWPKFRFPDAELAALTGR